uniref:Secreted protein n=1 Tax=Rhipicephalus appendiculatus TaxID=34631 RepID=A0A131YC03_RHIAP
MHFCLLICILCQHIFNLGSCYVKACTLRRVSTPSLGFASGDLMLFRIRKKIVTFNTRDCVCMLYYQNAVRVSVAQHVQRLPKTSGMCL